MLGEICEFARAKINLGLKVLPIREDGFHNIESVFHTVNLYDTLYVSEQEGYGKCNIYSEDIVLPMENTLSTAYSAFCRVAGIDVKSVNVRLEKKIPCGGGLGGGSSDSAALVRALEKIHSVSLNSDALNSIAGSVGSDVFFFCQISGEEGGAALVTGRGETVRKIKYRSDLCIVLVFPNIHSSTKEAYSLVDNWYNCGNEISYPLLNELEAMYYFSPEKWKFVNSFTNPLCARHQEIQRALECVNKSGSLYSEMSGSGSTVFGVYDSKSAVKEAMAFLEKEGFHCVEA